MRSGFRSASLIIAILAALTIAAPVAAANQWTVSRQSGTNAFAYNDSCLDNPDGTVMCAGQSLNVFEGRIVEPGMPTSSGEQVCYSDQRLTFDPTTGEIRDSESRFGCARTAGKITIRKLNSLTLAPTVVELTEAVCDATQCTETPAGSITVYGTWIGAGPTLSQSGRFRFDDGTCIQVHAEKSKTRLASFEGSIDSIDARIGTGTFVFKTTCPF
jgi:hypothetical protein